MSAESATGATMLVGVDGSDGARDALRWAVEIGGRLGLDLRVVAAWSYPATTALPGGPVARAADDMDGSTFAEARDTVAEITGSEPDASTVVVVRGRADRALLQSIRPSCGLVVVGKRGLGPIEGRLLGSTSRRVVELSPVPVAVVPPGQVVSDGPVVVGVDGSEAAVAATVWATAAAGRLGTDVVVVHGVAGLPAELPPSAIDRIVERATAIVERHAAMAAARGVNARQVVEVVDPRALLRSVAESVGASMIVVGARGDGPASGLLIGTVVNHVVQAADHPVVVVPAR